MPRTPIDGPRTDATRSLLVIEPNSIMRSMIMNCSLDVFPDAHGEYADTADAAIIRLNNFRIDLIIMGLSLPDLDGLDLIDFIEERQLAKRILVISDRRDYVTKMFLAERELAGWHDPQGASPDSLSEALVSVRDGSFFPQWLAERRHLRKLKWKITATERLILSLLGAGMRESDAADALRMSPHTLHTHLKHIKIKLQTHTTIALVSESVRSGFVRFNQSITLFPGSERAYWQRRRSACATSPRGVENGEPPLTISGDASFPTPNWGRYQS